MPTRQPSDKPPNPPATPSAQAWVLPAAYTDLYRGFAWQIPAQFNIAQVCCRRWAALPDALDLIAVSAYKTRDHHFPP